MDKLDKDLGELLKEQGFRKGAVAGERFAEELEVLLNKYEYYLVAKDDQIRLHTVCMPESVEVKVTVSADKEGPILAFMLR